MKTKWEEQEMCGQDPEWVVEKRKWVGERGSRRPKPRSEWSRPGSECVEQKVSWQDQERKFWYLELSRQCTEARGWEWAGPGSECVKQVVESAEHDSGQEQEVGGQPGGGSWK